MVVKITGGFFILANFAKTYLVIGPLCGSPAFLQEGSHYLYNQWLSLVLESAGDLIPDYGSTV